MSDLAIRVEGIGKKYRIGQKKSGELRETFSNILRSFRPAADSQQPAAQKEFWALKDISFEVKQGEAVGIIGRNGAGKSTLLKVLSRITKPTTGRFEINGRVPSLLEVGTGFHPELTGRENIYLNGTILGMRRAEIKAKFDEIIAFSGVEEFIDTPVKHYSSGMKVRLAFSVAAHLEPEILIIDEVLAVGDAEFQKKCLGKMEDVTGEGRTVLFVSHNMGAVELLCSRGLLLDHGKAIYIGNISKTISEYLIGNGSSGEIDLESFPRVGTYNEGITLKRLKLNSLNGEYKEGDTIELEMEFNADLDLNDVVVGFSISDNYTALIESRSSVIGERINVRKGHQYRALAKVDSKLTSGIYQLNIGARYPKGNLEFIPGVAKLEIMQDTKNESTELWKRPIAGKILIDQEWKIEQI
jgi:lipopolysaccharide transport system ATP-binding protein